MAPIPATVKEVLYAMPEYANKGAIANIDKTIQFNISGDESGSYYLEIKNGTVTTHEGTAPAADVTIDTPADVWKQIATGDVNGAVAFMTGKFKAAGDITLLMAMQNWFRLPGQ